MGEMVEVDLRRFILDGDFAGVRPGRTKKWLRENFPTADEDYDTGHGMSIETYGDFEFLFERDLNISIFCDSFSAYGAGKLSVGRNLLFKPWFFESGNRHSLSEIETILNQNTASFSVKFDKRLECANLRVLKSGVNLHFDIIDAENGEDALFILTAMGLVSEE